MPASGNGRLVECIYSRAIGAGEGDMNLGHGSILGKPEIRLSFGAKTDGGAAKFHDDLVA